MPTARIKKDVPFAKLGRDWVSARLKESANTTDSKIKAGMPIGLLLALTYATGFTVTTTGMSPRAGIRTTD